MVGGLLGEAVAATRSEAWAETQEHGWTMGSAAGSLVRMQKTELVRALSSCGEPAASTPSRAQSSQNSAQQPLAARRPSPISLARPMARSPLPLLHAPTMVVTARGRQRLRLRRLHSPLAPVGRPVSSKQLTGLLYTRWWRLRRLHRHNPQICHSGRSAAELTGLRRHDGSFSFAFNLSPTFFKFLTHSPTGPFTSPQSQLSLFFLPPSTSGTPQSPSAHPREHPPVSCLCSCYAASPTPPSIFATRTATPACTCPHQRQVSISANNSKIPHLGPKHSSSSNLPNPTTIATAISSQLLLVQLLLIGPASPHFPIPPIPTASHLAQRSFAFCSFSRLIRSHLHLESTITSFPITAPSQCPPSIQSPS